MRVQHSLPDRQIEIFEPFRLPYTVISTLAASLVPPFRTVSLRSPVNRLALPKNASWFVIPKRVGTLSVQNLREQNRRVALFLLLLLRLRKDFLAVW